MAKEIINGEEVEVIEPDSSDELDSFNDDVDRIEEYIIPLERMKRLVDSKDSVPTHTPSNFMEQFYLYLNGSTRKLYVWINKGWLEIKDGIANLVEDTTPQLGGDLDLNGKNIDFPSTANISDVKDEDDMATDSATMLATQQSIKKYVDDQIAGVLGHDMLVADMSTDGATVTGTSDILIASHNIAANTLGTNKGMRVTIYINKDSENWTGVIELTFGTAGDGHSVIDDISVSGSSSGKWVFEGIMYNSTASAQDWKNYTLQDDGSNDIDVGTAMTKDTSNQSTLKVIARRSSGSEAGVVQVQGFLVELLPTV